MATIQKRGDSYRIRVSQGYDVKGKQIMKSKTWTPDKNMTAKQIQKELERQAFRFEEQCRTGQTFDSGLRFSDFSMQWLEKHGKLQLKERTFARYSELLKRTNEAIGHIKFENITPNILNEFYSKLSEEGIRSDVKCKPCANFKELLADEKLTQSSLSKKADVSIQVIYSCVKGNNIAYQSAEKVSKVLNKKINELFEMDNTKNTLSPKTVLHYHRLVSSILSSAVNWQVIFSNPCERIKPPKVKRKEAKYLDEFEAKKLLDCLESEDIKYRTVITILIHTGLRRGEVCGLNWKDIDFKNSVLHINKSLLYMSSKGVFEDDTKTQSSNRSIKVSNKVTDILGDYKNHQLEQKNNLGTVWCDSNKIFTSWNGKPMHPDSLSAWFRKFLDKNDLPKIPLHALCHTCATLLINKGVPLKAVSSRLGHSNLTTTANIYAHSIRSADAAAAEILQNIL